MICVGTQSMKSNKAENSQEIKRFFFDFIYFAVNLFFNQVIHLKLNKTVEISDINIV